MDLEYASKAPPCAIGQWCAKASVGTGAVVVMLPELWYLGLIWSYHWITGTSQTDVVNWSCNMVDWPEGMVLSLSAAGVLCGAMGWVMGQRRWSVIGMAVNGAALASALLLRMP